MGRRKIPDHRVRGSPKRGGNGMRGWVFKEKNEGTRIRSLLDNVFPTRRRSRHGRVQGDRHRLLRRHRLKRRPQQQQQQHPRSPPRPTRPSLVRGQDRPPLLPLFVPPQGQIARRLAPRLAIQTRFSAPFPFSFVRPLAALAPASSRPLCFAQPFHPRFGKEHAHTSCSGLGAQEFFL